LILLGTINYNKNTPFYAWECITIKLKNRDVDLVIRKDKSMNNLLFLLLYHMNTINGTANSAANLIIKI